MRNEGCAGVSGDRPDLGRGAHVLRQIEIVDARGAGGLGDRQGEKIGAGIDHRILPGHGVFERLRIAGVEHQRLDGLIAGQITGKPRQHVARAVGDGQRIVAGGGEKTGNGLADLAAADDEDVLHAACLKGESAAMAEM